MEHPIRRAGRIVGSVAALGRKVGVNKAAAHQWLSAGVPIKHCGPIEKATGGAVMRWDLRPEDWWVHWPELVDRRGSPEVPREQAD
jgi:DNA-binding transcriptional regulator YdaS (Cro superfamily)